MGLTRHKVSTRLWSTPHVGGWDSASPCARHEQGAHSRPQVLRSTICAMHTLKYSEQGLSDCSLDTQSGQFLPTEH